MGHGQALLWAMASWATGRPCWGRPWAAGRPCCGLWPHGPQTCARTCIEMFVCICIDMCPDMVSCSMRRSSLSPTARPAARCRFPRLLFFSHILCWPRGFQGTVVQWPYGLWLHPRRIFRLSMPPQSEWPLTYCALLPTFWTFFFSLTVCSRSLCTDGGTHSALTGALTAH